MAPSILEMQEAQGVSPVFEGRRLLNSFVDSTQKRDVERIGFEGFYFGGLEVEYLH
jgi:hypothetical protein